jgi:hypothetical protein
MNEFAIQITLIIISGILIPAIPTLIVTVFLTRRNDRKVNRLFEIVDKKADKKDVEKINDRVQIYAEKWAENMGRFQAQLDRFDNIERRMEERLKKT